MIAEVVSEIARMGSGTRSGILLSGYFGCGNLGDDMLLSAAVAGLRAVVPNAQFLIRDNGDLVQLGDLGKDVTFTGVENVLAGRKGSKAIRLIRYLAQMASLLRHCRWLIFAGGTVFHEKNHAHSLIIQWMICRLARLLGVRIAALGVGISDLHLVRARWLIRDIVGISELFLVRDQAAQRQIARTAARVTGDLVFDWKELALAGTSRGANTTTRRRTIGLAVCPSAFDGLSEQRAIAAFGKAVHLWHEHGHNVVFLIFQKSTNDSLADQIMFEKIAARLAQGLSFEMRALMASPQALAAAYRDIDVMCGMRFHGFVLAALLGIPFVGVAHDNKISEICREFSMACLDAETFDGATLAQTAEAHLNRRPDPALVERSAAKAHENFRAFAELLA